MRRDNNESHNISLEVFVTMVDVGLSYVNVSYIMIRITRAAIVINQWTRRSNLQQVSFICINEFHLRECNDVQFITLKYIK